MWRIYHLTTGELTSRDTIIFTYLGFETVKTVITNDWVKNNSTKIKLTEKIYVLDEIKISQYNLTGYLEVDTKIIPVNENYRANIAGLLAFSMPVQSTVL